MPSAKLIISLIASLALMTVPLAIQLNWRGISPWKGLPISLVSTIGGTSAAYLWFFLENGRFGGISFYGVIFLAPLLFLIAAKLLKLSFRDVADVCAAAECVVLVIMKGHCKISGCCGGKFLFELSDGTRIYFPSQIAELFLGVILFVLMMLLSRCRTSPGALYPTFMILYGATRFVLNFFRWDQSPFLFGLTAGTFWSLCAVVTGSIWLLIHRTRSARLSDLPS